LLVTPLTARLLVRGKLWGVMDGARAYLVFSLVPLLMLALAAGFWCALTTVCFWFLTWGFIYFQCANAIYWSVRSANSWQSLLKASSTGLSALLWRGFLLGIPGLSFAAVVFGLIGWLLPFGGLYIVLLAVGCATPVVVGLFGRAEDLLQKAESHLSAYDRAGLGSGDMDLRQIRVTADLAYPTTSLRAFRAHSGILRARNAGSGPFLPDNR
jgi:hypothetical protein